MKLLACIFLFSTVGFGEGFVNVCNRNPGVRAKLEETLHLKCQEITEEHLKTITNINIPLSADLVPGDLQGFVSLHSLWIRSEKGIVTIKSDSLDSMPLERLGFSGDDFTSQIVLEKNIFSKPTALDSLFIRELKLLEIQDGALAGITTDIIDVYDCTETKTSANSFAELKVVLFTFYSVFKSRSVPAHFFSGVEAEIIDLSQDQIRSFELTALENAKVKRVFLHYYSQITPGQQQALTAKYPDTIFSF